MRVFSNLLSPLENTRCKTPNFATLFMGPLVFFFLAMSGVSLPPAYSPDDFSSSCVSCQKAVASLNYVIRPSMPWGQKLLIRRFGSCSWAELLAPLAPSKGCARDASYSGKLKLLLQQAFTNSIRKQGKHTCSTRSR